MATPSYYTTCVDSPPKGIKGAQVFGSYSAARDRATELSRLNLTAAVYETNKSGAAKSAEPLFVAHPPRQVQPSREPGKSKSDKTDKPGKEKAAK